MKCANCDSPALYVYDPKPLRPTSYCATHLPTFLRQAAKAGLLPVTDAFAETRQSAIEALRPASAPAEETVLEETAEEAPAPKKRRRSPKKAEPVEEITEEATEESVED